MLNLDTHVLIHAVGGKLTAREDACCVRIVGAFQRSFFGKLRNWLSLTASTSISMIRKSPEFSMPCTFGRSPWTSRGPARGLDVHVDPADELIAATSLVHKVPLVTRDRKLLSSKLVAARIAGCGAGGLQPSKNPIFTPASWMTSLSLSRVACTPIALPFSSGKSLGFSLSTWTMK